MCPLPSCLINKLYAAAPECGFTGESPAALDAAGYRGMVSRGLQVFLDGVPAMS